LRTVKKNIQWVLVVLMLIVLALHTYVVFESLKSDYKIAFGDALASTVILSFAVWGIILFIKSYPTTAVIYLYAITIAILLSIATTFADLEVLKWLNEGNTSYLQWLKDSLQLRFLFILLFNAWMATNEAMRKILSISESRFQLKTDASVLLKEAELFKLRQQLQPHFLYNSLNSINALIMIAPDKAQSMVGMLSDFLRSSVKRESEDTVKIEEELEYLQSYLDIESVRFGDRLLIKFDKSYTDDATIPPFLLQPIIENAIKFGLYGNTGNVNINVRIALEDNMLVLTITNPYDANAQPPRGTGFGLESIKRRLWLLFGRSDLLETIREEQYFTTILKIPQLHV